METLFRTSLLQNNHHIQEAPFLSQKLISLPKPKTIENREGGRYLGKMN